MPYNTPSYVQAMAIMYVPRIVQTSVIEPSSNEYS